MLIDALHHARTPEVVGIEIARLLQDAVRPLPVAAAPRREDAARQEALLRKRNVCVCKDCRVGIHVC